MYDDRRDDAGSRSYTQYERGEAIFRSSFSPFIRRKFYRGDVGPFPEFYMRVGQMS